MKNGLDSSRDFPESRWPFFLLNVLVYYVTWELAKPFPSSPATLADATPCTLHFPHVYTLACVAFPVQSCLLPSPNWTWPPLGWWWAGAPRRPGRSLRASEPHGQSQNKAGATLGNFRSVMCLQTDKRWSLTYVLSFIHPLLWSYFTALEIQKIYSSSVTGVLPGIIRAGNEKGGNRKEPKGPLGKETLLWIILDI